MKKRKKKKQNLVKDMLKAARKESRTAEIKTYGKPINRTRIQESSKIYKRDKCVDLDDL